MRASPWLRYRGKIDTAPAATYLQEHYDSGGILIDDTGNSRFIHQAAINLSEYIATYSGPLWQTALYDPATKVEWVVMRNQEPLDRVSTVLILNHRFQREFAMEGNGNTMG